MFNDESIINHSNKELKKRGLLELIKKFGPIAISDVISGILGSVFWFYLATMLTTNDYGEIQFFISIAGLGAGFAFFRCRWNILYLNLVYGKWCDILICRVFFIHKSICIF